MLYLTKAHEDHDGLRHWEIPSKDPDRIILTFHGDPSTSRAVTWRTDKTITKAVAQIAEARSIQSLQAMIPRLMQLPKRLISGNIKGIPH